MTVEDGCRMMAASYAGNGSRADVDDLAQDARIAAWRCSRCYRPQWGRSQWSWVRRDVEQRVARRRRQYDRQRAYALGLDERVAPSADAIPDVIIRIAYEQAAAALPKAERRLARLLLAGLTQSQAAAAAGRTQGSQVRVMRRLRALMREALYAV